MTTEDDFQQALDADPGDHHARLVSADWLQDRGDPRAEGYRALGLRRLQPSPSVFTQPHQCWGFSNPENSYTNQRGRRACVLPRDWWEVMDSGEASREHNPSWNWHPSRRAAEDVAALAFANLPTERRAELLAGVVPTRRRPSPPKSKARTRKKPTPKKGKGKK
jgi:uncharacterized protein (TIGR02996 family)